MVKRKYTRQLIAKARQVSANIMRHLMTNIQSYNVTPLIPYKTNLLLRFPIRFGSTLVTIVQLLRAKI